MSRTQMWKHTMVEEDEEEEEEEEEDEEEEENGEVGFEEEDRKRRTVSGRSGGAGRLLARPCCQADGCNADLTNARPYHRRHKVCEFHAKAPVVLLAALDQRFCQQCSRFHVVTEFDERKRSCRRRLAGHNQRRRKNMPEFHGQTSTS